MAGMKTVLIVCAALTLSTSACKSGDKVVAESDKQAAEKPAANEAKGDVAGPEAKPAPGEAKPDSKSEAKPEAKAADFAGTYTSENVTLAIPKMDPKTFDFHVSSPSSDDEDDPCGGIDYKGTATFDTSDPTKATTEFEGHMRFAAGAVNFEPSMEMIGNDCSRRIDVDFKKATP